MMVEPFDLDSMMDLERSVDESIYLFINHHKSYLFPSNSRPYRPNSLDPNYQHRNQTPTPKCRYSHVPMMSSK